MYGAPVWGDGVSSTDIRRIDTMLFKVMRQHLGDYQRVLSNWEICQRTRLRNFKSMRKISNAVMLHKFVTEPNHNTYITERLIMQSTFSARQRDQIRFFDFSSRRVGRSSFINRLKEINESMPPLWFEMSKPLLKIKIKECTQLLLIEWCEFIFYYWNTVCHCYCYCHCNLSFMPHEGARWIKIIYLSKRSLKHSYITLVFSL